MEPLERKKSYGCPVEATLDVIGGKWTPVILFHLMKHDGPMRFGEIRRTVPSATQQMVTTQLRKLESDGIIHRNVYAEVPPRVEYSLTSFGESLRPIIDAMYLWGCSYEEGQLQKL